MNNKEHYIGPKKESFNYLSKVTYLLMIPNEGIAFKFEVYIRIPVTFLSRMKSAQEMEIEEKGPDRNSNGYFQTDFKGSMRTKFCFKKASSGLLELNTRKMPVNLRLSEWRAFESSVKDFQKIKSDLRLQEMLDQMNLNSFSE